MLKLNTVRNEKELKDVIQQKSAKMDDIDKSVKSVLFCCCYDFVVVVVVCLFVCFNNRTKLLNLKQMGVLHIRHKTLIV